MPRPPDLLNLVAWLFALWLVAAAVMLGLTVWHPSVRLHWSTSVYLASTVTFSLLAFGAMGLDKYRARTGGRRVPELSLHMFELFGGWPGSMLGQRTFHHKTRKITYQAVFWWITAMHLVLLVWMAWLWWSPITPQSPEKAVPASQTESGEEWSYPITPRNADESAPG